MNNTPVLSIIIPTVNTPVLTHRCLESVLRHTSVSHEVWVVNNSTAKAIRRCLNNFRNILIIQNSKNLGFAKAVNQGARLARGRYLCFLNTDTVVPPRWAERLIGACQKPGVGAAVPCTKFYGYPYAWPPRGLAADESTTLLADQAAQHWWSGQVETVQRVRGFCLLIPRVVMARVGLFDERFFFGLEDDDISLRLRLKNYRLVRLKSLFIYHLSGGSTDSKKHLWIDRDARGQFFKKWGSYFGLLKKKRFLSAPKKLLEDSQWRNFNSKIERCISQHIARKRNIFPKESLDTFLTLRRGAANYRPPRHTPVVVTVMMIAHNAEAYIRQAIESVLNQSFKKFELRILDDASTDKTFKIASAYKKYPHVKVEQNLYQMGIAASRNKVLKKARGRYVAICDSDDMMRPLFLEAFASVLDNHPQTGWVYADRVLIDEQGRYLGMDMAQKPDKKIEFKKNIIAHAGALIRKDLMLAVGSYDESLLSTEDYDLALKISKISNIKALTNEAYYFWRRYPSSTSRTNPWAAHETRRILART